MIDVYGVDMTHRLNPEKLRLLNVFIIVLLRTRPCGCNLPYAAD